MAKLTGDFMTDFTAWAKSWIANAEEKRQKETRLNSLEAEIRWLDNTIADLTLKLERRPSTIKQIRELERQKRRSQIEIAFLNEPYPERE